MTAIINPSDLRYQSVSQEQESAFVTGFLNTLDPSERPSETIINRIGKSVTVKAMLVFLKNQPSHDAHDLSGKEVVCGVVVYEESLVKPKRITIHLLRTTDDHLFSGRGISRHMLYKVTSLAKGLQCQSIYASVNPLDRSSQRFFEGNSFAHIASSTSQEVLLAKNIDEEVAERKRHVPDTSVYVPAAKVARAVASEEPSRQKIMEVTLKQQYLSLIKSGKKTIEGRIAAGMFSRIDQGAKIRFFNQQDQVSCLVTRVAKYPSFAEMLQSEGVEKCLPGSTLEEGKRIYDNIPGYKERAQKSGVFAIELIVEGR